MISDSRKVCMSGVGGIGLGAVHSEDMAEKRGLERDEEKCAPEVICK